MTILAKFLPLLAATGNRTLFVILAVILAIAGIVMIFRGSVLLGIILIIAAFAVGPGGWFILD